MAEREVRLARMRVRWRGECAGAAEDGDEGQRSAERSELQREHGVQNASRLTDLART